MVAEELPCDDSMVLLDHLQVLVIEALPEPCFVPSLLKESWGHVANNVHLRGRGAQEGLRDNLPNPSFPPRNLPVSPKASRHTPMYRFSKSSAFPLQGKFQHSLYPVMNVPHAHPALCLCPCCVCHLEYPSHFLFCKFYSDFKTQVKAYLLVKPS